MGRMWALMEGDGEDAGHHGGRWGGCGPSWRAMGMMWASWRVTGRMRGIMEGDGVDAGHHGG